jgi:hypothetical protein
MAKTEHAVTRRGFFGLLGAVAVAPKVLTEISAEPEYEMVKVPVQIMSGGYFRPGIPDGGDLGRGSGPAFSYRLEKRLKARR